MHSVIISVVSCTVVLARVQAFLPVIEQENKKLEEKIILHGQKSVQIDADINDTAAGGTDTKADSDDNDDTNYGVQTIENLTDEPSAAREVADSNNNNKDAGGTVQLEFAIGDFDGSAVAELESDS
jgi:hypothetical protein